MRRESFKFWFWVRLILEILRYIGKDCLYIGTGPGFLHAAGMPCQAPCLQWNERQPTVGPGSPDRYHRQNPSNQERRHANVPPHRGHGKVISRSRLRTNKDSSLITAILLCIGALPVLARRKTHCGTQNTHILYTLYHLLMVHSSNASRITFLGVPLWVQAGLSTNLQRIRVLSIFVTIGRVHMSGREGVYCCSSGGFHCLRSTVKPLVPSGPLGWRRQITRGSHSWPTLFRRDTRRSGRWRSLRTEKRNSLEIQSIIKMNSKRLQMQYLYLLCAELGKKTKNTFADSIIS